MRFLIRGASAPRRAHPGLLTTHHDSHTLQTRAVKEGLCCPRVDNNPSLQKVNSVFERVVAVRSDAERGVWGWGAFSYAPGTPVQGRLQRNMYQVCHSGLLSCPRNLELNLLPSRASTSYAHYESILRRRQTSRLILHCTWELQGYLAHTKHLPL